MPQENLIGFGEGVLLLHQKLREFVKQSDLFDELNSLIHKMMDVTVKRKYSMDCMSRFSKNCTIKRKRNSQKPKKASYSLNASKFENGVSDFKLIKPCFVKLDKICDSELSKYLAEKLYSNKIHSDGLERAFERTRHPNKNLSSEGNINSTVDMSIDHKFLATEDHLDLLMAKEMESSCLRMEKRLNRGRCLSTNNVKYCNLRPVVLLKRLSPQFISQAVNGKLKIVEPHDFARRRVKKVSPLPRIAGTSDKKLKIYGNKENVPRPGKKLIENEKSSNSDDEAEFYGFENPVKNRRRIKKVKDALKLIHVQPSGNEKRRIIKLKDSLKALHTHPAGKENGTSSVLNRDMKNFLRYKIPFKAINSVEAHSSADENIIFKDPTIEDVPSSISDSHLNDLETKVRNKMIMVRNNNSQSNETADVLTLNQLEIFKLFKKRENALISKMVRDQGTKIVSKTGELVNEDHEPLNYYSNKYYIKRTGRRVPLWAEESIRRVIIESQEEIPIDIIAGYFHDPHDVPERLVSILFD